MWYSLENTFLTNLRILVSSFCGKIKKKNTHTQKKQKKTEEKTNKGTIFKTK